MNNWPIVKLGEVVTHRKEFIEIDELQTYKRCRVQLHVKGIVLRDEIEGALIKTKQQQVCRINEFLVAEIDAKVGGYGIVPPELNGAIVSSHYFLFTIDESKLEPQFLGYYIKTPFFRDQVSAQGTTNYAAIRPQHVLNYAIPLPPLSEQRRIVAKIEQLAAKIEEAWGFRENAINEADTLLSCALHEFFEIESNNWKQMPMTEAIVINDRQVDPTLPEYSQLPHISGENIESKTCKLLSYRSAEADGVKSANYLFFPNTILYSKIRPYLRKAVFVNFQGVCSADIYPIKLISDKLEPQFLMWSLVAGPFTQYANLLSGRTRMPKLNRKQLFAFSLYYPTIDEQRRIVAYLDGLQAQVDRLKALQAQTAAELEALLPSILDKAFKGEL